MVCKGFGAEFISRHYVVAMVVSINTLVLIYLWLDLVYSYIGRITNDSLGQIYLVYDSSGQWLFCNLFFNLFCFK